MNEDAQGMYEVDCPWFDPTWLPHHPEFPLAASAAEHNADEEDL